MNTPARTFLAIFVCCVTIGARATSFHANEKPNIIFIVADDLGFNQTRAYGDSVIVHTPNAIKKGRVDDTPWAFADVLPTLADVPLTTVPRVKTNGTSIGSLLYDLPQPVPQRTLYWEFGKQAGDPNSGIVGEVFQTIRRGRWKAVR